MSRMIHNGDISYSSINAHHYSPNRDESCFRSCFLNLPYATITSTFLVVSGLIITFFSTLHLASVLDRLSQDLFYKRYPWLTELRVVLWFIGGLIALIILVNLLIGFATASMTLDDKVKKTTGCAFSRRSTTNCLVRFVFFVNQVIFLVVLCLLVLFCISSFSLYLLTVQCNDDTRIASEALLNQGRSFSDPQYHMHMINLRPFAPEMFFEPHELHLLVFRDNRLKTLCRDYVSTLTLYNLITLLGVALLFIGFHCYLINLTVNRIRIATYKKYTELLFLNGTELNTFNDTSYDNGERF